MRNYKLEEEELKQIKKAMTQAPEAEVRQRATAIHLLHQENKPEEVGAMLAVSMGCIGKMGTMEQKMYISKVLML